MAKSVNLIMVTLTLVLLTSFVFAAEEGTRITGIVYDLNTLTAVEGVNVSIDCNSNVLDTTSNSIGQYTVIYDSSECTVGDTFDVSAEKNGLYGSNIGVVHDKENELDLGVANVPMVPEFTTIVGIMTLMAAVGIFFVVRK